MKGTLSHIRHRAMEEYETVVDYTGGWSCPHNLTDVNILHASSNIYTSKIWYALLRMQRTQLRLLES